MQEEHEQTNLSDILNGTEAEAPSAEAPPVAAEAAPAPTPSEAEPEPSGQSRVPKGAPGAGQFAGKPGDTTGGDATAAVEPAADAPAPEDLGGSPPPDKAPVPQAALMNERRRRQEAEGLARELKARLEALTRLPQGPTPAETPKVEFWDDPDAALSARFDQFGNSLLDQFEQRQLYRSINKSEAAARARYDDFDEAIVEYERAVATNPTLAREMANADDPGEFAYRKGKSLAEVHQYGGDIEALLAAKRAEWEADLRASAPPPTPTLPPSTATERSVAVARSGPAWTGPKPLGDILDS